MVMVNTSAAFVLFLLLCAAWLSSARLHPGAEVNATSASMISAATDASSKSQPSILIDDENKSSSKKVNVETSLSSSSLSSHYKEKRQRRSRRHWSDEVDKGFVAFSADYHGPRHHPPKNN